MAEDLGNGLAVFPARAGMSPGFIITDAALIRVPRASGDEPNNGMTLTGVKLCSPRERG